MVGKTSVSVLMHITVKHTSFLSFTIKDERKRLACIVDGVNESGDLG